MMLEPCGYRILVKTKSITEVDPVFSKAKKSGIVIPEEHGDIVKQQLAIDRGEVLAIGPYAFHDLGGAEANKVKVGSTVIFAKYAGKVVEHNGQRYVLLNDEDVVAVINGEQQ
jgi:chaperonin GroES